MLQFLGVLQEVQPDGHPDLPDRGEAPDRAEQRRAPSRRSTRRRWSRSSTCSAARRRSTRRRRPTTTAAAAATNGRRASTTTAGHRADDDGRGHRRRRPARRSASDGDEPGAGRQGHRPAGRRRLLTRAAVVGRTDLGDLPHWAHDRPARRIDGHASSSNPTARIVTVSATYGVGGSVIAPRLAAVLGLNFDDRVITPPTAATLESLTDEERESTPPSRWLSALARVAAMVPSAPVPLEGDADPVHRPAPAQRGAHRRGAGRRFDAVPRAGSGDRPGQATQRLPHPARRPGRSAHRPGDGDRAHLAGRGHGAVLGHRPGP